MSDRFYSFSSYSWIYANCFPLASREIPYFHSGLSLTYVLHILNEYRKKTNLDDRPSLIISTTVWGLERLRFLSRLNRNSTKNSVCFAWICVLGRWAIEDKSKNYFEPTCLGRMNSFDMLDVNNRFFFRPRQKKNTKEKYIL